MYRIAIQPDEITLPRGRGTQSFSKRWVQRLRDMGHVPVPVDANRDDFFEQVAACDGFMWTLVQATYSRHFGRRVLAALEHATNIPVFPSWKTIWHFDDKIGQDYLLRAAGFPTPRTWVFWYRHEAVEFCRTARYPMVFKLASGIMSRNVEMVHNLDEAQYWINRMFGEGLVALEKPSIQGVSGARRRVRDALRLLVKGLPPHSAPFTEIQRGYALLQEFIPGNEFDHRVTVVGNRAFAFRRLNRPNDFRASGSGRIEWDPSKIDPEMVRLAFSVQRALGSQSLAMDGIYRDGTPVIVEISYIYDSWAVEACPGHWELRGNPDDGHLEWVEGRMWPEDAILDDFLALIGSRRRPVERQPAQPWSTPVGATS